MESIIIEKITATKALHRLPMLHISYIFRGMKYNTIYHGMQCVDNIDLVLQEYFIITGYIEGLYNSIVTCRDYRENQESFIDFFNKSVKSNRGEFIIELYPQINKISIPYSAGYCNLCFECEHRRTKKKNFGSRCCDVSRYDNEIQQISKLVEEKIIRKHDLKIINDLIICNTVS